MFVCINRIHLIIYVYIDKNKCEIKYFSFLRVGKYSIREQLKTQRPGLLRDDCLGYLKIKPRIAVLGTFDLIKTLSLRPLVIKYGG